MGGGSPHVQTAFCPFLSLPGGEMGEEHTPYSDQCMQTSIFDQQFFCLTHLAWVGVKLPGIKYKFCQNMDFFHLYYIKRRQLTKTL